MKFSSDKVLDRLKIIKELLVKSGRKFTQDRASRLAAALSYYMLFSMAPMLIILVTALGAIAGQLGPRRRIITLARDIFGLGTAEWIDNLINNFTSPGSLTIATVFSIVLMFWSASNIFTHLKETLNIVWEVKAAPGRSVIHFIRGRLIAFAAIVVFALFLVIYLLVNTLVTSTIGWMEETLPALVADFPTLSVLADTMTSLLPVWRAAQIAQFVLGFLFMLLVFTLVFKGLPDAHIPWRDVLVGAAFTALLFIVGMLILSIYFTYANIGSLYGAAGSVLVVLFWFYYSAQIMLFGAEFTQVFTTSYGSSIRPADYAIRITGRTVHTGNGDKATNSEPGQEDEV